MIEQLRPDAVVTGPLFPEPVRIILTTPMGTSIKLVGAGVNSGQVYQPVLKPEQVAQLTVSPPAPPFDGNAQRVRLGVEALRLGLAYEYDPYFALSIARIDPLPHQLEAVYEYFMKSPRIRFLLADDPGAGKTIMAGLLLQELRARGLINRVLIVAPANLTFQWQRELRDKFRLTFDILNGAVLRANYGMNPWQDRDMVITSVSWVSRIVDARDSLLRSQWDLIIVDEAHKMSSTNEDDPTLAYRLGEALSERTDHYLLMTATPHKGDPQHFARFLRLLDRDVYGDVQSLELAMRTQDAPFYLRRVKEALVTFPDPVTGEVKKLFTRRVVRTIDFKIDHDEWDFYEAVFNYVTNQSQQAANEGSARGRVIGFTMAMLQRRAASSAYAARRTLERMRNNREKILVNPERYRQQQIARHIPDDFDELPEDEQQELLDELEQTVASVDPNALRDEISTLDSLVRQARQLEVREVESKLSKLKETLAKEGVFADPKMKVLIFTEHKDTLDYLAGDGRDGRPLGKLREWGLTVTQIHGGMKIGDRNTPGTRIYAEQEFREPTCQAMVATEAAGEGINLQFCWFMINYDIPWNPVRLEQRMGRIHRYGQERDCLIVNFVATNTREGRVLETLFDRVRAIERDLDPHGMGTVFNVLGDVFPANQLERMVRDMYARNLTEDNIRDRIVREVDVEHFRTLTQSALEGLAKRELNLATILGKTEDANARRLVPEVVEEFFKAAAPEVGLPLRTAPRQEHIYQVERIPRHVASHAQTLDARVGALAREYRRFTFDKELVKRDPTIEWVTPGHALFETVRSLTWTQVQPDLARGAVFFDLNREHPSSLDLFSAAIKDGRGRTLHERLFVIERDREGNQVVRQPTLFLELIPAPPGTPAPDGVELPPPAEAEHVLVETHLGAFLDEVARQRMREIDVVAQHMETSLNALIQRQQLRAGELYLAIEAGDDDPLLKANLKSTEDRLDELNARLERKRRELAQERHCMIDNVRHLGRAWVLPHPERSAPNIAPMVRDDEIERIAVQAVTSFEEARGWKVESVESENRGFDLISRRFSEQDPSVPVAARYIEVKGRASVGAVMLSSNEYSTAYRLKEDYWLYVVFNCATDPNPLPYCICDPVRLRWEPMQEVIQYRVDAESIMDAAVAADSATDVVEQALQNFVQARLSDLGEYNLLVEGLSDKVYLELAARLHRDATGVDLLENGRVRIVAGRGTKKMAAEFGVLQALEQDGLRFVVMLDGDDAGRMAAEALGRFGAQKNRHYFQLDRADFKDKAGKSWDVEIEDLLPWPLVEAYLARYPDAAEEHYQRSGIHKVVIQGKPVQRDGQVYDFKMMLTEFVRQQATIEDVQILVDLLRKARQCMGLK